MMRRSIRNSLRISHFVLVFAILPFVAGFDIPDSAGTYAKVSGGRGAYHLTGCHRSFDSEVWEGQVSMRHAFNTASQADDAGFWKKLSPDLTTLGYQADFVTQELTVVKADSGYGKPGDAESARGFMGGGYLGADWKWVGMELGLAAMMLNLGADDAEKNKAVPLLGLRVGLTDGIYGTVEVGGSVPYLTGGGQVNFGVGGKFGDTRAWIGGGGYGFDGVKSFGNMGILKVDQGFGPWALSAALMGSGRSVPPAGLGIDHEYGFSLGLSYRLSSLD
jgi:hypothetical protein